MIYAAIIRTIDDLNEKWALKKLTVAALVKEMLKIEGNMYTEYDLRPAIWELLNSEEISMLPNRSLIVNRIMCGCVNVKMGSYDNQIRLVRPDHMKVVKATSDDISVDKCIADEIQILWKLGIWTTGCCCGHNIPGKRGYIGVLNEDIQKMKDLGYRIHFNPCRPNAEDSFVPKSLGYKK